MKFKIGQKVKYSAKVLALGFDRHWRGTVRGFADPFVVLDEPSLGGYTAEEIVRDPSLAYRRIAPAAIQPVE